MKSQTAVNIVIGVILALSLFHIAILIQFIPYESVWGGRIKSIEQMYALESAALSMNIFFIFLLMIKGEHIRAIISMKIVNVLLWMFLLLFLLNTVGNLLAEGHFEKAMAGITLALTVLLWFILRPRKKSQEEEFQLGEKELG